MSNQFEFRIWCKKEKNFFAPDDLDTRTIQTHFRDLFNNPEFVPQFSTGKSDKKNKKIFQGDIVKFNNQSEHTRKEYWFPVFEVTWDGFEFGLKYLGGGKSPDNIIFYFRYYSKEFEILGNIFESEIVESKLIDVLPKK